MQLKLTYFLDSVQVIAVYFGRSISWTLSLQLGFGPGYINMRLQLWWKLVCTERANPLLSLEQPCPCEIQLPPSMKSLEIFAKRYCFSKILNIEPQRLLLVKMWSISGHLSLPLLLSSLNPLSPHWGLSSHDLQLTHNRNMFWEHFAVGLLGFTHSSLHMQYALNWVWCSFISLCKSGFWRKAIMVSKIKNYLNLK